MERNGSTKATTYEFQFPQPKEKLPFKYLFYNPKEGSFFGRTPASWSRLLLFYLIFYAVLAGLFAICMQGLFAALNDKEPRWKLDRSIIGTNPGLGFRPLSEETERGSVIKFNTKNASDSDYWKGLLDEFLEPYLDSRKLPNQGKKQKYCDFNTTLGINEVCAVGIEHFANCTPKHSYGYLNAAPCIFLKLNKIFDWEPEYYDNINELPEEMPQDLKDHIKKLPVAERKQVWISCKGQHDYDDENVGPIEYVPSRGFPSYFYPYRNVQDYLSPLVAVRFPRPKVSELVSVECRAWAKNIIYSGSLRDRKGSVTFQILLD